ncbi:MAG: ABC transporter permease [Armatimonadota bacterium]
MDTATSVKIEARGAAEAPARVGPGAPDDTETGWRYFQAQRGWSAVNWAELWRYRELLYFFVWRDVKVRYKQTALGVAWAILQPVLTMIVFSFFFGKVAGLSSSTGSIPYPLYVFSGLLPWLFFATAVGHSGESILNSARLITKVYFPRLSVPVASVGAALIDLAVSCSVLVVLMLTYGITPGPQLLILPVLLAGLVLAATGVGTLLASLSVVYRDFKYVIPFTLQIWMFVTPIIYPASLVPEKWRWVLLINPMAGLIGGFRSALLGEPFQWGPLALSLGIALGLFLGGAHYFRSLERRFADII